MNHTEFQQKLLDYGYILPEQVKPELAVNSTPLRRRGAPPLNVTYLRETYDAFRRAYTLPEVDRNIPEEPSFLSQWTWVNPTNTDPFRRQGYFATSGTITCSATSNTGILTSE